MGRIARIFWVMTASPVILFVPNGASAQHPSAPSAIVPRGTAAAPCRDSSAFTRTTLLSFRELSRATEEMYERWRVVVGLPTIPDALTADTAVVAISDTTVCRRAVAKYNALRGDDIVTAVSVIRYANRYIVFSPAPDSIRDNKKRIANLLDMSFSLQERIYF